MPSLYLMCFARILSKENRVNVPEPGHEYWPLGAYCVYEINYADDVASL